jgi:AcrR family transcriptional regulator
MATPPKGNDLRVRRTRQQLQRAFLELLHEKGFLAMSVQNIAERAMVNRGTFYAHFADKYMLADALVRERFQHVLEKRLPPTAGWNSETLHELVEAVFTHVRTFHGHCQPVETINPLFERSVQEELATLVTTWLKEGSTARWRVPVETIAQAVSWSIVGTAITWSQSPDGKSAREMADDLLLVINEGVAHLASNAPSISSHPSN